MEYYNHVEFCGKIVDKPFSLGGRSFLTLETKRESGKLDRANILLREDMLLGLTPGDRLGLSGKIATLNTDGGGLLLFVKARRFFCSNEDINEVLLEGVICKRFGLRTTASGRMLCSFILGQGKSYIPCVAWGENARALSTCGQGTCLALSGRLQSRRYKNKYGVLSETFEVSAGSIEIF